MSGDDFRTRMLDLARQVHNAPDDDAALALMREATGLSITDPDADRRELDRRAGNARGHGHTGGAA